MIQMKTNHGNCIELSISQNENNNSFFNTTAGYLYGQNNETALKDFVNFIALYKENNGQRELTAIKLSDFEKLKELYNKIKF